MAYRDKSENQEGRTYLYKRCITCRAKVHITSCVCWKCGQKIEDMTYGSSNPEDAIYNWLVNRGDICVDCPVTQRGKTCRYSYCFGTGKGKCDMCREFEGTRFDCCQKCQRQEKKCWEQHNTVVKQNNDPSVENIIADHKKAVGL